MRIYRRPHHEVYPKPPPKQDFLSFDEASDRVYADTHSSGWTRTAGGLTANSRELFKPRECRR